MNINLQNIALYLLISATASSCSNHQPLRPEVLLPQPQNWVKDLGGERLPALVEEALANNHSIKASLARVRIARAQSRITAATLLPSVDVGLGGSRTRSNSFNTFNASQIRNQFGLNSNISWEADIWGRARARESAAVSDARAASADFAAAQLLLASEVSKGWFTAIESSLQVALAERQVKNFEDTLKIITRRYKAGVGEALDVRLARENLASAKAAFVVRQQRLDASKRALESLLGRYSDAAVKLPKQLPALSGAIAENLPAEQVHRRPDLVAARQRLFAALSRETDAQKNLLPRLVLTGTGGTASNELKNLLDLDFLIWTIAANLTQPVFAGGRLKAERQQAAARQDEALANYATAVLRAFQEVETRLAAEPLLLKRTLYLKTSVEQLQAATQLALSRYSAGLATITTLLDTQRRAFNAESNLLDSQLNLLRNRIDLHLALGGGFEVSKENEKTR